MKLRNKVLVGISFVWILFLVLTYVGSRFFLIHSFLKLESQHSNQDLERVDQALDQINYSLYTFASDWSHWNDVYHFMQGKNPTFVANNMTMTAFLNSTINLASYWDKKGRMKTGMAINTRLKQFEKFPKGLDLYLTSNSILLKQKNMRGYILLPSGIMMITANAVTDSNKKLPPLGVSIFGRNLSPKILQKIADTTKFQLELILPSQLKNNAELRTLFQNISSQPTGHFSQALDDDTLQGFTLIRDIYHNPIGMFRMTTPRAIYLTGLEAIHYYLTSFIILGVIFSLLMLWLLRILIIKRLEHLDHDVAEISANHELSRRVDADGTDELSSVATQINQMMDIIEASQGRLEQRVLERTEELSKTKEHLVQLAHYDHLTSLPNRVFFNEMLNKSMSHAKRHDKKLAILFIDLDRFKKINDGLGHAMGDLVLKEVANRFVSILRAGDIVARLGGDEFIVLLNDIEQSKYAGPVAEKLLKICEEPIHIDHHEFFISASIGICVYPEDGASLEELQKNADIAMYKAKHIGGSTYQYFTKEMNIEAHEHIKLEAALRKAITQNEFVLHYQPKFSIKNGTIMGVEALIRWNNPELGMISPAKFIPFAEETGLIMQIGEWSLREACKTIKSWQNQGYLPFSVAVNLSPKQFRHQDIANLVSAILLETGLDPSYLELEITETAVMDNVDLAIAKLNTIEAMGVSVAIDDFGTGYTSISYLKQFPVSVLKIDQSFIKGIPANSNDAAITSAFIALAHNLGIKVVAEGVETAAQLQYLADHACDIVQGYYLSRPLPEEKLLLLLQSPTTDEAKMKELIEP